MRLLLALAAASWVVVAAVAATGGFSFRIAGALIRSHSVVPSLTAAVLLTIVAMVWHQRARAALAWWWSIIERRGALGAAALAVIAVFIGLHWGTFAAGGSDSYCYLNQAELFARGEAHDYEPFGADPAWPGTPGAFVPAGHSAVPSRPGAMVPICPAGYSLMLAGAKLVAGRQAMFWVTPLMGGLLVWLTFLLGRRIEGGAAGLLAAVFVTTSPIFIYQVVQPMNDVPAAALWCAALVVASRADGSATRRALLVGLLCGGALAIRPNLLPLAAIVGAWMMWSAGHLWFRAALSFGAALVPGVLVVLAAQAAMYGSPLRSGYGDLSALFSTAHVLPNLARYPRWVIDVHSPILLLGLLAPLIVNREMRRTCAWLLAFAAGVLACYLPYVVFDVWWYQRFMLPALLPLFALTASAIVRMMMGLHPAARAAGFVFICGFFAFLYLERAAVRETFKLQEYEQRFRAAGEYIAATLPPNAAFITGHQTGSIRFYSGRSTAGWGDIRPGDLADAIEYLRRNGRKPYLLFEDWEEPNFRTRFSRDPLGSLGWPPVAEINRRVRIYDPDDYPKYMRGEFVPTERIVSGRR